MNKTEIACGFSKLIREEHPNIRIYDTKYLSIDNNHIHISSYPYDLDNVEKVIVICFYTYTVITQESSDCFFLFLDNSGWKDNYYILNDWKVSFGSPTTSSYHTYGRTCRISNGTLNTSFYLTPIYDIAVQVQKVWPYLLEATKCSTQKELDFLSKSFRNNIEIETLQNKNLNMEYLLSIEKDLTNAYKSLLNKIESLVNDKLITTDNK